MRRTAETVKQFLSHVQWGDLEYLIIDTSPALPSFKSDSFNQLCDGVCGVFDNLQISRLYRAVHVKQSP
ncbi:hypothetical protein ACROYT_G040667 [Oculina patagonica]